jgi:glucosylceramidase
MTLRLPKILLSVLVFACILPTISFAQTTAQSWITNTKDQKFLQEQLVQKFVSTPYPNLKTLEIFPEKSFQKIEGFGFTLTGGSSSLICRLPQSIRIKLLQELFGNGPKSIGISVLRIGIGSTDLDSAVYSYDDLNNELEDLTLSKFSIQAEKRFQIPLLKEILQINPKINIIATPWSPPVWMKDNKSSKGGQLKPFYYSVYADYLVKYLQSMQKEGIRIFAITPQNEPLNPDNNPSLYFPSAQQNEFIKYHLGPLFEKKQIPTKILLFDHNCDHPEYAVDILNDPITRKYVAGSAFHLYGGNIQALSTVRKAHPDKDVYFTEQWTGIKGDFEGDFMWHMKNVIIGALNNDAKTVLEWNLANDASWGPHTPGGCTECLGALTISNTIQKNVAYYIIAQIAKFVPRGSHRIELAAPKEISGTAFERPDKKKVILLLNEEEHDKSYQLSYKSQYIAIKLPAKSAITYLIN